MPAPRTRGRYTQEELEFAVNEVHQGRRGTDVARDTGISYETIMRKVRLLKAGKDLTPKRRGPKPLFADSFEQDTVAGGVRCTKVRSAKLKMVSKDFEGLRKRITC
ncbi:hypothetical protein H257_08091 [Aphanomyces astaci]|uniref:Uncharacterized protein n=1 Tax=Aphanomyces astaci TaxID=112090 RepID=W4GG13_APHAT|nr:hypothetical protein H257_08091 [Aphanomyces astaci]ETV78595.1 hypothetical protein H257_08091 [Aphanomyces astaci]|eukprot:XP_009832176.1 hypothetical protein H257_08091 [Aphanomyces astaci]